MEWNQDVFNKNIEHLLEKKFGKGRHQGKLNEVVGRDAVTRWKGGDRPSLEILMKTANFFKCSVDDLINAHLIEDSPPANITPPAPSSDEIGTLKQVTRGLQAQCDMLLTGIASHDKIIHDLQARISSIEKRITDYAASGDKAKLRQTG